MKPGNAIEVKDITKKFKVYMDKGHTLKEKALFRKRRAYEERSVLNGISFEVKKGEAIGLIGHNGCGKSTTLKMLAKIMYPDNGTIELSGRVSSLIELGAGFHPDLSGRENIYINASIFGLTRQEIDKRIEDIIEFSELEEYIDNPVRTYSSGMYMRLAFSVAIYVDADILLIDEILSVGDAGFQVKCFNRLKEIKAKGTTVVIVSHALGQIEQICERSIWIHEGKIQVQGKPREVHPQYLDYMGKQRRAIAEKEEKRRKERVDRDKEDDRKAVTPEHNEKRWGNGKVRIQSVRMLDKNGYEATNFKVEESVTIVIDYKMNEIVKDAVFGIGIFRIDGIHCYGTNTRIDQLDEFNIERDGRAGFVIDSMMLLPGKYVLDAAVEGDSGITADYWKDVCEFEIFSTIGDVGIVRLGHRWHVDCG